MTLPPMPPTEDRQPWDDDKPNGYLETDLDWVERNGDALTWLIDNHKEIRAALATSAAPI